jgi:Heptaprenyl diphosphate synthase (HEPPP synthase) subunit 1.
VRNRFITVQQLEEKVKETIRHPFLSEHFDMPEIAQENIQLVLAILTDQNLNAKSLETYASAVMLVQIALDSHDRVENGREDAAGPNRPLSVLAGDYFSGLYYWLLSEIPDIRFIRTLAEAIRAVNESKIQVYHREVRTVDELMEKLKIIDTYLYQKLASYFRDPYWEAVSRHWLHIYKLKNYREKYIRLIQSFWPSDGIRESLEKWLDRYTGQEYEKLGMHWSDLSLPLTAVPLTTEPAALVKRTII